MNGKRNLLILTSEKATEDYLDYLRRKGIPCLAVGKECIDSPKAKELLASFFDLRRLAVCGGGHINGSFLSAGLNDENQFANSSLYRWGARERRPLLMVEPWTQSRPCYL